jgi:hypothetical protein
MSLSKDTLDGVIDAIHAQQELTGVVVGLYGDLKCSIADVGVKAALPYWEKAVIIEEVEDDLLASVPVPTDPTDSARPPAAITNRSRIWTELGGAGLNCGFAVISAVGVAGGAAAELPSGGTSTFLVVVAWAGLVTSSVQCVNGIVRTVEAATSPDSDSLARWDQNRIYTVSFLVVDAIGVAAGLASLGPNIKNLLAVLERRGGLPTAEALAKMGREARAKAIQDALNQARRNPESAKILDQALKDALSSRTVRRVAKNAVIASRNAAVVSDVIADETARRLARAIVDVIGSVDTPIASGLPSDWVGSASGSVNAGGGFLVHVVGLDAA